MIVRKQKIPDLKILILSIKILEEKGRGIITGFPSPLFVKCVLFRIKGCGNLVGLPCSCSPRIILSTPELSNEVLHIFVSFVFFEKIEEIQEKRGSKITRSDIYVCPVLYVMQLSFGV